jgi:hypothetical protein
MLIFKSIALQVGIYTVEVSSRSVESLQSHCIHTMSHWSSGLPVCFLSCGTQVQFPRGYLCETGILLLVLSRYSSLLKITC